MARERLRMRVFVTSQLHAGLERLRAVWTFVVLGRPMSVEVMIVDTLALEPEMD